MQEFHYRVSWRSASHFPGHHRSVQTGPGLEFSGLAPLLAAPDLRRIDVRASLSDPMGQWYARTFRQRSDVPVYLLADLSASMGYVGKHRKLDVLADFTASLGYSAYRTGDPFGFIGFDDRMRPDFLQPPTRHRGASLELARRLRSLQPTGRSARGLESVPERLGNRRALVFLVSDFHFALNFLSHALIALRPHDIVPVVIWDEAEFRQLPAFGIGTLRDRETGHTRAVLMRTGLHEKIAAVFARRTRELTDRLLRHGVRPLFMMDGFLPDAVTEYFFQ